MRSELLPLGAAMEGVAGMCNVVRAPRSNTATGGSFLQHWCGLGNTQIWSSSPEVCESH
jgi:hypothetical protein